MKITVLNGEDWSGLYIDDVLEYEGHDIPWFELIGVLIQKGYSFEIQKPLGFPDESYLQKTGKFPKHLKDVIYD